MIMVTGRRGDGEPGRLGRQGDWGDWGDLVTM
jgi:hypothetical protein